VTTRFGALTLDADSRQLLREGRAVRLSPKAFELLVALLDARPRALSKAELQERLWPDTFVAEANLSNLVAEIRDAIGDSARTPRFVRTVHGFGYAFSGGAATSPLSDRADDSRSECWLAWGRQQFPLNVGEHIIGRDRHADIRLDASTVSRRHARLTVLAGGLQLEDLGSKNGTFCANERITEAVRVSDGDIVRIGSLTLTIHLAPPVTTDTALST
jgi:DNA-binding winged helix-turn-helix (wHTH) protein